jgi:hypothetical protein
VYKYDSFVGFIGDEEVHAQECYDCPKTMRRLICEINVLYNSYKSCLLRSLLKLLEEAKSETSNTHNLFIRCVNNTL